MNKLEMALEYASWGWHVLPVVKNGKSPATAHGVHDATTDEAKIKEWWQRSPELNIGIATGQKSGITVFDIDPRNGGTETFESWVEENGGQCLTNAQMQETGGGGQHYVSVYNPDIKSTKLGAGVDVLSDGRYFIVAPSIVNGGFYDWEASSDPFDGVPPFNVPDKWLNAMGSGKIKTSLEEIKSGAEIVAGGRHSAMVSMAGAMREYGLTLSEIYAAVSVANDERCYPPLKDSEISTICEKVSKYSTDNEGRLESIALGSQAADNILAGAAQEKKKFFLNWGDSFINEPAPIPWIIKGWIPAKASGMMFGPSGVGKSFVAVDMACSISTGSEWFGVKPKKKGVVVYLAGEGNWGMRSRIASWCKDKGMDSVGQLLISNAPIDLDSPGVSSEILTAIQEMTDQQVDVIFIDTLNRHMAGDENSAQDVRALINVCSLLTEATGASTMLIHHTGHGDNTKNRERGSSALRGAMDVSILVSDQKGVIKVSCVKQKDAREPQPVFAELKTVSLGWLDEDGIDQPGAVVSAVSEANVDQTKEEPIDFKLAEKRTVFEDAWLDCGREYKEGKPYLTRSAFLDFLLSKGIFNTEKTARNQIAPGKKTGLINCLIEAEIIADSGAGWVVIDPVISAVLSVLI